MAAAVALALAGGWVGEEEVERSGSGSQRRWTGRYVGGGSVVDALGGD